MGKPYSDPGEQQKSGVVEPHLVASAGNRRRWLAGRQSSRHGMRPPWWPADEAWPPENRRHWRQVMRHSPFARRFGCLFIAANLFGILLFIAFIGIVLRALGEPRLAPFPASAAYAGMGLLLTLGIVSYALAAANLRHTTKPLDDLVEASEKVATGDFSVRVEANGPPETRSMVQAFNSMASRLEAQDRQRRAMLADVTHELRTPLTVIRGTLEGFLDGLYPADNLRLESLLEEVNLLSRIADDMRMVAEAETKGLNLKREQIDLNGLVAETVSGFHQAARASGVELGFATEVPVVVLEIDGERIRQVVSNLVMNALKHSKPGGSIRVKVTQSAGVDTRTVTVSVSDDGSGIAQQDLPHVFDRYYKSADSRGMGIGLSIAKFIVEAHGGTIAASSAPGKGTTIRFTLPDGSLVQ